MVPQKLRDDYTTCGDGFAAMDCVILPVALPGPNLKSCMKDANNSKRLANRLDGNLGLGNRYRLGEASFYLYHLEMEGADKAANLTPELRDSFRLSIDAAADANRLSTRADWALVRSKMHRPVVPPTDGRRYWFGIARGLRKAK